MVKMIDELKQKLDSIHFQSSLKDSSTDPGHSETTQTKGKKEESLPPGDKQCLTTSTSSSTTENEATRGKSQEQADESSFPEQNTLSERTVISETSDDIVLLPGTTNN